MQESSNVVEGTAERSTLKQRAAVQREVARLLNDLAPERPPPAREVPLPAVKQHRSPGRCILQSASAAVSVSWFPARPDEDTLGEILVIAWRGTVSLPGSANRTPAEAVPLGQVLLHPIEADAGEWEWQETATDRVFATPALATYCREMLEQ